MAILHLRLTPLTRSKGDNTVETAARYAAVVLKDGRTGNRYDFTAEIDVTHQEIIGPENAALGDWWRDREVLWNAAEAREIRVDARVASEWQLGLPYELAPTARIELSRCWARFLVERYGNAVDLSVHTPPPDGDPRNHYAKLIGTTRQLTPSGFGAKVGIERRNGEQSGPRELRFLHRQWKCMVDAALASASG